MDVDKLLAVISDILTDRYNVPITAKSERQETETNAIIIANNGGSSQGLTVYSSGSYCYCKIKTQAYGTNGHRIMPTIRLLGLFDINTIGMLMFGRPLVCRAKIRSWPPDCAQRFSKDFI